MPTLFVDPWITSRVNGAVAVSLPKVSSAPGGWLASVSIAVRGSSRRVALPIRPFVSRAVSAISRYDGKSWSGASNAPLAAPVNDWIVWLWHEPLMRSQCCSLMSHVRPLGAIGSPSKSVAEPLNAIRSSTLHLMPGAGAVIVITGTGGWPAVIGRLIVSVRPPGSVTLRRAV